MKTWKTSIQKITNKIKYFINKIINNTHNHYACYLPGEKGRLLPFFLNLFFSGIVVNKNQTYVLNQLKEKGIIIYASKYKSYFEYLFYHTRFKQNKLPFPEIGMDYKFVIWQPISRICQIIVAMIDHIFSYKSIPNPYKSEYIKQELLNGKSGMISLVSREGFYLRFVKSQTDPLEYLIKMQKTLNKPIFLVPQLMLFGTKPDKRHLSIIDILFGSEERPGLIRRLVTLFRHPKEIFVEISKPLNLQEFLDLREIRKLTSQNQSLELRQYLIKQVNRHRQSITGPVLKSRQELKENILTGDKLQTFMKKHAKERDLPIWYIHKKADSYINEIAANYNPYWIKFYKSILTWMFNTLFEGIIVDYEGLAKTKLMSQRAPLILIPCHKSHLDYLILSYIMNLNNMPCPHIAAGKNLSFWPLGPMFRSAGAFFIRRTFKGAVLYSKVFTAYVEKLLEEGFNIEFFIEGGRSRTGKLLMPKLGLLSVLIKAFESNICDDLIFAPVFIGYDRVLEEREYMNEIEGGHKKPESLVQVIRAGKFLKKRYGKVYIKFHKPISLNEYLLSNNIDPQNISIEQHRKICRDLGYKFINSINNVSIVTPHGVVASAILNCSKKLFSYDHLMIHVESYMKHLVLKKVELADTLNINPNDAFNHVISTFVQRKFIEGNSKESHLMLSKAVFKINENKRPILDYYKNNCITFFVPAAFTALAILEKDAFQFSSDDLMASYNFLQDIFINEFAYEEDKPTEYCARKTLKTFIDDAIIVPHPTLASTYNITSAGFRKLQLFAKFLKPCFESYLIVLNYLKLYPKNSIDSKNKIKHIQSMGIRMYKKNEIELSESLSKMNYKNAATFFSSKGINGSEDQNQIEYYMEKIKTYLNYLPF